MIEDKDFTSESEWSSKCNDQYILTFLAGLSSHSESNSFRKEVWPNAFVRKTEEKIWLWDEKRKKNKLDDEDYEYRMFYLQLSH